MLVAVFNLIASPVGLAAFVFIAVFCLIGQQRRVNQRKAGRGEQYPKIVMAPLTMSNPRKGRW